MRIDPPWGGEPLGLPINLRGMPCTRLMLSTEVLWHAVCPDQPVRLVIRRNPERHEQDDFLFTTNLDTQPETVVADYVARWCIEDTFRNVKQHLGGEDPQCWKAEGPERAAAFAFWLYSVVWIWYVDTQGCRRSWILTQWYRRKHTPSFREVLAHAA